jgi:hypothetical protein
MKNSDTIILKMAISGVVEIMMAKERLMMNALSDVIMMSVAQFVTLPAIVASVNRNANHRWLCDRPVLAMSSNVIRFPQSRRMVTTTSERLAARRAYRKGIEQLALKEIEKLFRESAHIPGAEAVLLKDARLLFVASVRRAVSRAIE